MKTYSQLFHELDLYSKKFLENQLNNWQTEQAFQFNQLADIFNSLTESIKNPELRNPYSLWTSLDTFFNDLNVWIKGVTINADNISSTFEDWHEQTQHFFRSFPANMEEEVKDTLWLKENSDNAYLKVWKFHNRRKNELKRGFSHTKNAFRKILKKTILLKEPVNKSIVTQDFFNFYFTLPFQSSIYEMWQKHLQLLSRHLAEIHKETEEIVHPFFTNEKFKALLNPKSGATAELLKQFDTLNQILKDFQEKYNVFKKEILAENKLFINNLKTEIDYKWKYAATFIVPTRKFKTKRFQSVYKKFEKEYRGKSGDWQRHINGEKSDWQKDNELSIVQLYSGYICHKTIRSFKTKLDSLLPVFIEPRRMVENSLKEVKNSNFETADIFRDKINALIRNTLRTLHREKLPLLADAIVNSQFTKTMENYLSQMENKLEELSEEHTIFRMEDLNGIPPESRFIDIPLKDIITEEIFSKLEDVFIPEIKSLSSKIDLLIRSVSENDQIIELNFDTALELLESDEENPLSKAIKVSTEGLERSAKQLADLVEDSKITVEKTIESLIEQTLKFETQVHDLSNNDEIIALKIRAEKAKTQDKIRGIFGEILQKGKSALPGLLRLLIIGLKRLQALYFRIRKISGLGAATTDVEERLSQFLYQTKKQLKGLPFVYQRLFRFQPLDDSRFFACRDDQMSQLKYQLEHWKKGNFALTALIGEKGSGRTTILNFAENEFYNNSNLIQIDLTHTIYKEDELFKILRDAFKLTDCKNMDDLEQKILSRETNNVCIIENLHNMFLRVTDGFEAIERFLLFISNTHLKVHWIVTCGIYSWSYLDKVLNIHKYFHKSIILPDLNTEDLKQIILRRHRVSGYKLFFETPEEIERNRKFRKLSTDQDKQDYLNTLFFEQLSKLSAGNITVAILFWLSSIKEIKDDNLIISPVIEFEASFMQNMPAEDLFTFAAFLQHETLTAEQHAFIFNQDLQKSLLVFNRMKNKGMLSENINGYQVHYLLYRPVVRTLKINNHLM